MQTVVSLDPGVTTGFCIGTFDAGKLRLQPGERAFSPAELDAFLHDVWQKNLAVVYERFDFRNAVRTGTNLTPAKMIGVIELFCEQEHVPVYDQMPHVQGKSAYWTNDKLKKYGVYARGLQHGRSATKHLLYWWQFGAGYQYHRQSDFRDYILEV